MSRISAQLLSYRLKIGVLEGLESALGALGFFFKDSFITAVLSTR